jgi:hypothetical protein
MIKLLSSVESVHSLFEWAGVLLLAFTFVAGFGIVITSRIINRKQAQTILELSNAANESKEAQQKVEVQLAESRTKQAEAERMLLEIQERFTPRTLTGDRREQFVKSLENAPRGKIEASAITGDPEAFTFATQIWETLRDAGFDVGPRLGSVMVFGSPPVGVLVGIKDINSPPLHAVSIREAFGAIGVPTDGRSPYGSDVSVVYIQIGSKPSQ